jgi:hypothetical protein
MGSELLPKSPTDPTGSGSMQVSRVIGASDLITLMAQTSARHGTAPQPFTPYQGKKEKTA